MSDQSSNSYVTLTNNDGIATIEFFHPQSNSLPAILLKELAAKIEDAGNNISINVIVLRSAGDKAFCAGASFDELMAIRNEVEGLAFFSGFAILINAMRNCPKFIIGRIQGKCVGGGVGLAAACDYTFAATTAAVKLSELTIGIGPFVVGPAVERKIGTAAFSQLAIDADSWQSSEWALQKGLYTSLHSDTASLDEAVGMLADTLNQSNPEAMAIMKNMLWKDTEYWDQLLHFRAAISGKLVLSDYTRQAIAAFKKK